MSHSFPIGGPDCIEDPRPLTLEPKIRQWQPRCHPMLGEREQAVALQVRRQPGGMYRMTIFHVLRVSTLS